VGTKLTTEEVIKRIKETHGDTYDLSKFVYTTQRSKSIFICKEHGEFLSQPKEVWGGTGCPICGKEKFVKPISNWDDVKQKILSIHGDVYDFDVTSYMGVGKEMGVTCRVHEHTWFPRPIELIIGHGCPKCRYVKSGEKLRTTVDDFIKRSRRTHGDRYDYSKVHQFKSLKKENVTIICSIHGEFEQNPYSHFTGSNCPNCVLDNMSDNLTTPWSEVLKSFLEVHGDKYEYHSGNYVNSSSRIEIVCPEHGQFEQNVTSHKHGQGCPKCGRDRISSSLTTPWEEVLESFRKTHRDEYSYNPESYTLLESPMEMVCKKHGRFEQTPKNHRMGSGCPVCKSSRGEKEIEFLLREQEIEFEHQKKFPDLSKYYRYDFFIPSINTIVEYNGLQHYEPIEHFGGIKSLRNTQKRDKIKKLYCLDNGINYEIIRFDEDIQVRMGEILKKYGLTR